MSEIKKIWNRTLHQSKLVFVLSAIAFLLAIGLLIAFVAIISVQKIDSFENVPQSLIVASIVIQIVVLLLIANVFGFSCNLKNSLGYDNVGSIGKTIIIAFIWMFCLFYAIVFIVSNLVASGCISVANTAWCICQYVACSIPLVVMVLGFIIYRMTKNAYNSEKIIKTHKSNAELED